MAAQAKRLIAFLPLEEPAYYSKQHELLLNATTSRGGCSVDV